MALRMLTTRVLLTEDRLAQDFVAALERRELPEKFFYWFPTSVRAWLNLCGDGAYRNYVRSHGLVQAHAADIAAHLPEGDATVVSLGAGQGDKDLLVLEQIRASGRRPSYVPVDASQSLLLGNTLGAFDPPEYARALARLLRPEDHLIVDGEIFSDAGTLAGYDNPLNRQFAFGPLRGAGLVEPDDGALRFETIEDDQHRGLFRLRKHFLPARDLTLQVAGETVRWREGQRVETFLALLAGAGLAPVAHYASADDRFVMALMRLAG